MQTKKVKSPAWFTILSILAIFWNLIGVLAYLGQVMLTDEMKAVLPPEQLAAINETPVWVNIAFGVAVWFGILAAITMSLKRKSALLFFQISFLGIFTQQLYTFFFIDAISIYGSIQGLVMPSILLFVGVLFILVNKHALRYSWIK